MGTPVNNQPENIRLGITPEVMQLILDILEQKVLKDLNLKIRFTWSEDLNWNELMIFATPLTTLTNEQEQQLRAWMKKKIGGDQQLSFWDHIRLDIGV